MESPITLGASMGLSFFLAIGIVYAVQGVKWLCEILPTTKTNLLPSWVWVGTALVIAGVTCYLLKVDALAAIGVDAGIYPPLSYLATGLAIGISSNVVYAVSKPIRKKLKTDEGKIVCLPSGEEPPNTQNGNTNTQSGNVSQNTTVSETGNTAKQETPVVSDPPVVPDAQHPESASGLSDQSANEGYAPVPYRVPPALEEHVWPYARLLQDVTPDNGKMYYVAFEPLEETLNPMRTNREK